MWRMLASTLVLLGCMGATSAQPPNAVFAINGVVVRQGQALTDEEIERLLFQPYGSAAGVRQQLESQLAMQIADLDRACSLTDGEKTKLQLAGRGDIKR